MLSINTLKPKTLEFDVQIRGIEVGSLKGFLRFEIDDVEFGFPVKINHENINVIIPPLSQITSKNFKNNDILIGKLEVFGNGFYLEPWSEKFQIESPMQVSAKLKSNNESNKMDEKPISVKSVKEDSKSKDSIPELDHDNLKNRLQALFNVTKDKSVPKNNKEEVSEEVNSEELEVIQEPEEVEKSTEKINPQEESVSILKRYMFGNENTKKIAKPSSSSLLKSSVPSKSKITKKIIAKETNEPSLKEIYTFMENKGLKSKKVQESIVENIKQTKQTTDLNLIYESVKEFFNKNKNKGN